MISRILSGMVVFLFFSTSYAHQIAVGSYDDQQGSKPFVLVNQENQWTTLDHIIGFPITLKPLYATTAHCSGENCLVGGGGVFDMEVPYLIVSQDKGKAWFYPAITGISPTGFEMSMNATYCTGNQCMVAGSYHEFSTCNIPLFLSSTNGGQSFKSSAIKNLPRIKLDCVDPSFIECGNDFCVSGGNYVRDYGSSSMLALFVSKDKGQSWNFIDSKAIANLPVGFKNGNLQAGNCQESACTLVGSYNKHNEYTNRYPLILTTQNSGKSWSFVSAEGLPNNIEVGYKLIKCVGNSCVATGIETDHAVTQPFIVTSHDRIHWNRVPLENSFRYDVLEFGGLDCSDKIFLIAANRRQPDSQEFFFLRSEDQGHTWQRQEIVSGIPYLQSNLFGAIYYLRCENQTCFAGGYFTNQNGSFPLLLSSADSGMSWQFVDTFNHPSDMKGGVLYQMS